MSREYRFITNRKMTKLLELCRSGMAYDGVAALLDLDPSHVRLVAIKAGLRPFRIIKMSPKQISALDRWHKVQERRSASGSMI